MSSPSLVQSCLWTVTRWVPLVQQKLLNLPLSEHMSSLSLDQSCLWTVTRCVPLVQQTLLTFITAHEFTQYCSILSLDSDTMCAPSAAESSIEQGWVNSCALIKVRSFCCTRGTHRVTVQRQGSKNFLPLSEHMSLLSLVLSCLWTVTRCVPQVQQKLLTFITAHEFSQPCSILSLNSDTMGALVQQTLLTFVSLFKDKIEEGWVNWCAVIR
jgi:hypothetical protein